MNDQNMKNLIEAAENLVNYFAYHNKNTTKSQDDKITLLADALLKIKSTSNKNMEV